MPERSARVLWVEGKDDSRVVQSLCAQHDVPEVFNVREQGGIEPLMEGFPVQLRARRLERFGIVVDADLDLAARWDSIRNRLTAEGYTAVPEAPAGTGLVLRSANLPVFGVWIMPDNAAVGAIEDFAAKLVPEGDGLWTHAVNAVDQIPSEHLRFPPERRAKAQIHTWLSWQESPGSPMGQAITKGDLDARAPLAKSFIAWLRRLMVSDAPASSP